VYDGISFGYIITESRFIFYFINLYTLFFPSLIGKKFIWSLCWVNTMSGHSPVKLLRLRLLFINIFQSILTKISERYSLGLRIFSD